MEGSGKPCGCNDAGAGLAELETVPSPDDLQAALESALTTDSGAAAEDPFSLSDELSLDAFAFDDLLGDTGDVPLQSILDLVERFPGLKVTFSFG